MTQRKNEHRHLFIDFSVISERKGVEREMCPPKKLSPIITQDLPWRICNTGYYGQVIDDGEKIRMYASCGYQEDLHDEPQDIDGGTRYSKYGKHRSVQYLESYDGVHFTTPQLDCVSWKGAKTNIVLEDVGLEGSVFFDPKAPKEAQWKCIYTSRDWDKPAPDMRGLGLAHSADGIHWKKGDRCIMPLFGDSMNICYYDEVMQKYVLYFRVWTGHPTLNPAQYGTPLTIRPAEHAPLVRAVSCLTFDSFDQLYDMLPQANTIQPDAQDPDDLDIYTNGTVRYPLADDVVLAFPSLYRHFPKPKDKPPYENGFYWGNNGVLGTQLAVSRDGIHFDRIREAYISASPVGEIDSASNYFYAGMAIRGDRIYQYYWGGNHTHGGDDRYAGPYQQFKNAVYAVEQRIDGFCCAKFADEGGMMLTDAFPLPKGELCLNLFAPVFGDLSVALCDEEGHELPIAPNAYCSPIIGNYTALSVFSADALAAYAGKNVRLRFLGRSAKLFSYWFR